MPKIVIQNLDNKEIFIHNDDISLLDAIHNQQIDWMHACGKKGRCTTCKAIVLEGNEHLSPLTSAEEKYLGMEKLKNNERLTCQCKINNDIIIRIPEASKFPHITYSD